MDNKQKTIKKIGTELIEKLGLEAKVSVSLSKDDFYEVVVEGEDLGILIGYHGDTLNAFQQIFGLMVYKSLDEWVNIICDVSGYRAEREKKIEEIVQNAVQRSRFLQKPVELLTMPAFERRIVHTLVAKMQGVVSESMGEGYARHVVIKPSQEDVK